MPPISTVSGMTFSALGSPACSAQALTTRRLQRVDDPADDGLQRSEECPRRRDRIPAEMRLGAVRPDSAEGEAPAVRGGKLRPRHDGHLVHCKPRHVVQSIDRVAREKIEKPVLHHAPGAAAAFLGGLEDEMDHS